jgi:hypothetical protein
MNGGRLPLRAEALQGADCSWPCNMRMHGLQVVTQCCLYFSVIGIARPVFGCLYKPQATCAACSCRCLSTPSPMSVPCHLMTTSLPGTATVGEIIPSSHRCAEVTQIVQGAAVRMIIHGSNLLAGQGQHPCPCCGVSALLGLCELIAADVTMI